MMGRVVLAGLVLAGLGQVAGAQRAVSSGVRADSATVAASVVAIGTAPDAAVIAADACEESFQRGAMTAGATHSTSGWRTGGFVSGTLFSVFGIAGASAVAATTSPSPTIVPEGEDSACFRKGYRSSARGRNLSTAARSALFGALLLPGIYILRHSMR